MNRTWHKLVATISTWLVIGGLLLIGYGLLYWWMGFPYAVGIMLMYVVLGCLVVGAGLSLRRPETTTTLALATVGFATCGTILLIACLPESLAPPYVFLILISAAGALRGLFRLWRRRITSQ